MEDWISKAEFARRMGISRPAVTKAVKSGRVEVGPGGKINYLTESLKFKTGESRKPDTPKKKPGRKPKKTTDKEKLPLRLLQAKVLKLEHEVERKEIENNKLKEELIPFNEVKKALETVIIIFKQKSEYLPDRIWSGLTADLIKNWEKIKNEDFTHIGNDAYKSLKAELRSYHEELYAGLDKIIKDNTK